MYILNYNANKNQINVLMINLYKYKNKLFLVYRIWYWIMN